MRLVHVDLFSSAAAAIAPRVRELRPAELMRCTRALARCGVKNEAFCQAVADDICGRWSKQIGKDLRCEDLVELCWCFAVLEVAPHNELLQLMFQVLRETQKVSADALCQLYELHLSLESLGHGLDFFLELTQIIYLHLFTLFTPEENCFDELWSELFSSCGKK